VGRLRLIGSVFGGFMVGFGCEGLIYLSGFFLGVFFM